MQRSIGFISMLMAGAVLANNVPPDYPAQQNRSIDAQIEAVRQNYEDVKAKAQAKLDAQNLEREKQRVAEAKEKARKLAAERKAAAKRQLEAAEAKEKAERQKTKIEKRADEAAELDLQLKRLEVRKAQAQVALEEALSREAQSRAKDIVDAKVKRLQEQ